jgi:hypothetical protein
MVCRAEILLPLSDDCLEILGARTSWSPKGLSKLVVGLLYLLSFYSCVSTKLCIVGELLQISHYSAWNE